MVYGRSLTMKFTIMFALVLSSVSCFLTQTIFGQTKLLNGTFGNGDDVVSGDANQIHGTVGQSVIGITTNSKNIQSLGFWYHAKDLVTAIEQISDIMPDEYRLEQNYPNPFNPTTTIQFSIPKPSFVTIILFNVRGEKVTKLIEEEKQPGVYQTIFDASELATGVYFYRINAGEFVQMKKLMILK